MIAMLALKITAVVVSGLSLIGHIVLLILEAREKRRKEADEEG